MPKTLAPKYDDVPDFDQLIAELGDPFVPLTFMATYGAKKVQFTSPTNLPLIILDPLPIIDDEDCRLDDMSDWPPVDADVALPPLAVAALRLVADIDVEDQL